MIKRKFNYANFKWESYIWLLYLPYNFSIYFPIKSVSDVLWVVLCAVFLIVYILVNEKPRWRSITIPLEILITGTFAVVNLNVYMLIFAAWQIPFILANNEPKYFKWFATVYYVIFATTVYRAFSLNFETGVSDIFGLLFPFLSPVMSYVFASGIRKRRQMYQTNRRLEILVRRGERERIARDLHDTLGQSFSMITIKTELAKKLFEKGSDQVVSELEDIQNASRENLQLVRQIVNDLHRQSLSEVLLEQTANLTTAHIEMLTRGEDEAAEWSTEVQNNFAATVIEAITNVIRHANANNVQIDFAEDSHNYWIKIQDDGHAKSFSRDGSNGIDGMRNRMELANGSFEIIKNEIGTLVTLGLPKE